MRHLLLLTLLLSLPAAFGRDATPDELAILQAKAGLGMTRLPIGFWNYMRLNIADNLAHQQEADVEQWHEAGFTLPISPFYDCRNPEHVAHIRQMLDWLAARDMKMIVWDGRAAGVPEREAEFRENFAGALADFGGHPATFGFMVGDEPDAARAPAFCFTSRLQREMAPGLTPVSNLFPWWWPEAAALVGAADGWPAYLDRMIADADMKLLCYDHYAQLVDQAGVEGYYANLKLYRDAAMRRRIPFWTTLGSVGHWRYRVPGRNDIRWQFNTALCAGAGGVLWFMYYLREPESNYRMAPVDLLWETTAVYDDLRYVHRVFHRRYGDLFNRLVSTGVSLYPAGRGGFAGFAPGRLVRDVKITGSTGYDDAPEEVLLGEFIDADGNEYVMIVNASQTEELRVRVEVPGPAEAIHAKGWHGGWNRIWSLAELESGNLAWDDWLSPGQELLLRLGRRD